MTPTLLKIIALNNSFFGETDWYSSEKNVTKILNGPKHGHFTIRHNNEFAGYVIYGMYKGYLEGLRSAICEHFRGQGLSRRLYGRMIKLSDALGVPYWTYTAHDNLASINSHLKAGMKIDRIHTSEGRIWVDMIYRPQ